MKAFIERLKVKFTDLFLLVKEFVLKPTATWEQIVSYDESVGSLIKDRLLYYAAIPALATFLGVLIFGVRVPLTDTSGFSVVHRLPFGVVLLRAIFQYGFIIAGIWITSKIINYLAPRFGTVRNDQKAFTVAFYCSLPSMLASVAFLLPPLAFLTLIAGLYGAYLMYIGLPMLMQTPKDKQLLYFITILAVSIVVYFILSQIFSALEFSGNSDISSLPERF